MAPLDEGVRDVKKRGFCPICGSRCGGKMGTECPNHGIVNPNYEGYENYAPDPPGKQKSKTPEFIPTGTPLTAAIVGKNQLRGHPKGEEDAPVIEYLEKWKTDDSDYFDGVDDSKSDKNVIILPSLEEDDEDFEICEHGDSCPHVVETWVVLFGDDR